MNTPILAQITWEDNFGAHCDLLPGCVATHSTLEGVKLAFQQSVQLHIKGMKEDGEEVPVAFHEEFTFRWHLDTQAILKAMDGKVTRAAIARASGINERQLGHYITGHVVPRPKNRQKVVAAIHKIASDLMEVE